MKKSFSIRIAAIILLATLNIGCEAVKNTNNTQRGVAIGAVGGAVIGGILGNNLATCLMSSKSAHCIV